MSDIEKKIEDVLHKWWMEQHSADCAAEIAKLLSGVSGAMTATEMMIRSQTGEAFLQQQMDKAMMDERRRCLGIVRSIDPHNEAEAHLIETIVRRIRGEGC